MQDRKHMVSSDAVSRVTTSAPASRGGTAMGYIRHDAILVTSVFDEHIAKAHESAKRIFTTVSDLLPSSMNGYRSFLVPPDGSKEGWPDSDAGDNRRADFRKWVKEYTDTLGWSPFEGVYVNYGGDDEGCVGITDLHGLTLDVRCHDGE